MKNFIFTLDLESEYAGQVEQYEIFRNSTKIEEILSMLQSFDLKITVFVVGKIFELYPDVIKIFEKYNCEFEVHSYSHETENLNSEYEFEKAKLAYLNYFKHSPRGYRVPHGRISDTMIKLLEKHGFLYDSSIFPSYYPNPFRYLFCNRSIHYVKKSNIMEIPLTSITPFRLTLSLSYLKLLGIEFYFRLFRYFKLPDFICFNAHLHDFIFCKSSYDQLPLFWKFIYSRNKFLGMDYCLQFLEYIKQQGYKFRFVSDIYKLHKRVDII